MLRHILAPLISVTLLAAGGSFAYTVQPGDTLWGIARAHETTVAALSAANGIANPNLIRVGQQLTIPGEGQPQQHTYVVQNGDTLGSIAERFGVGLSVLVRANDLSNPNRIGVGQSLVIPGAAPPAPQVAATTYAVRPGDTLGSIARQFGTGITALAKANQIGNINLLAVGRVLTIPGSSGGSTPAPATENSANAADHRHAVAPGESLWSIARDHGTTIERLVTHNGIGRNEFLSVGQIILVPQGRIACPVPGAIFINDFGFPRPGGRSHQGNDLFAPIGTPVLAPVAGHVTHFEGERGGRQYRLEGVDGRTYAGTHLSAFGESGRVTRGTVIGYIGDSGNAKGAKPHLHFEIAQGDTVINPYPDVEEACH